MSRAYRVLVEVHVREGSRLSIEKAKRRLRDVFVRQEGEEPSQWEIVCGGSIRLAADSMTSLCGGESPDEAHERLCKAIKARGALGKRARVRTSWWFEERDPDDRFEDDDFDDDE